MSVNSFGILRLSHFSRSKPKYSNAREKWRSQMRSPIHQQIANATKKKCNSRSSSLSGISTSWAKCLSMLTCAVWLHSSNSVAMRWNTTISAELSRTKSKPSFISSLFWILPSNSWGRKSSHMTVTFKRITVKGSKPSKHAINAHRSWWISSTAKTFGSCHASTCSMHDVSRRLKVIAVCASMKWISSILCSNWRKTQKRRTTYRRVRVKLREEPVSKISPKFLTILKNKKSNHLRDQSRMPISRCQRRN